MKPDVIVVLGASLKDAKTLSPQTLENLQRLLEKLDKWSLQIPIILSGGFSKDGDNSEASLMIKALQIQDRIDQLGPIYIEDKSNNSSENVKLSLDIIQAHNWSKILVIDQPLHLFQLKLLFKHFIRLRHLKIELNFIPAKAVYGGNAKWWQYSHQWVYFSYLVLCTFYYILKRKINLQDII